MKRLFTNFTPLIAMLVLVLAGCSSSEPATRPDLSTMSIAEIAGNTDSFSLLAQAVQTADLASMLDGTGPYTVFAPTDEAFSRLPDGVLEDLMQSENQDQLVELLQFHIVEGKLTADDLAARGQVGAPEQFRTVSGIALPVTAGIEGVVVDDAAVVEPDIMASNGVIHGIGKVLLPPSMDDLMGR